MKLRFAQLGSYGINLGDNIALHNIRAHLNQLIPNITWQNLQIIDFFNKQNDIEWVKKQFKKMSKKCDALIVGGGGLIEGGPYSGFATSYKLPFTKETLESLSIPVYSIGLGYNTFRRVEGLSEKGVEHLTDFINHCKVFSVRNDGSFEDLKALIDSEKIVEVPDPGLLMSFESERKERLETGVFQPAWNLNPDILKGRGLDPENIDKLKEIVAKHNQKVLPHTPKDFLFSDDCLISKSEFDRISNFESFLVLLRKYLDFDYTVSMRGHSQLVPIGMNIPGIYFSTQDKVSGFAKKNGFENYLVDVADSDWATTLEDCIQKLKSDSQYVSEWYATRDKAMAGFRNTWWALLRRIAKDFD